MKEKIILQKAGLKTTKQRLAILALFHTSKHDHLSAEDIYHQLSALQSHVGLATVYRVITQFEELKILRRSSFEIGKAVLYELATSAHHDHLICTQCGHTVEFNDPKIEENQITIAKTHGFTLEDHQLTLFGRCSSCSKKPVQTN